MSSSEIKLDIDAIDNDLKRYKERIDNIDSYPNLKHHVDQRARHSDHLKSKTSRDISMMSQSDMVKFFDSSAIWSAQRRATMHFIIEDNGFQKVREYFADLYRIAEEGKDIDKETWGRLYKKLDNVGKGWFTEILSALNREHYVLYNKPTIDRLSGYGLKKISSESAESYGRILEACRIIADRMGAIGFKDPCLYDVDGFMNYFMGLDVKDTKESYWYYSPGQNASEWDYVLSEGVIGIGWNDVGDLSAFTDKNEMLRAIVDSGAGLRAEAPWNFVNKMKPGDIVFARDGLHKVIGMGRVKGEYRHVPGKEPFSNLRDVEWTKLKAPVETIHQTSMDPVSKVPSQAAIDHLMKSCKPVGKAVKIEPKAAVADPYTLDDLLSDTFLSKDEFEKIGNILMRKKNLILKGAPGVGKTYLSRRIAYAMMGEKDPGRVELVQFHQNYSYEEFIIGYKPKDNGFSLEKGVFFRFCDKAREDLGRKYFFIIDEINRGNLSKIFGEMLVLIEGDKRQGSEDGLEIGTAYGGVGFSVPDNVYIIGMMNTADRGLAMIDYALRRRFAFFPLEPRFGEDGFKERLQAVSSISGELAEEICNRMIRVNAEISNRLEPGYAIGHSFFIRDADEDEDPESSEKDWYEDVVEYEIRPLLEEYFYDEPSKVEDLMDLLRI